MEVESGSICSPNIDQYWLGMQYVRRHSFERMCLFVERLMQQV